MSSNWMLPHCHFRIFLAALLLFLFCMNLETFYQTLSTCTSVEFTECHTGMDGKIVPGPESLVFYDPLPCILLESWCTSSAWGFCFMDPESARVLSTWPHLIWKSCWMPGEAVPSTLQVPSELIHFTTSSSSCHVFWVMSSAPYSSEQILPSARSRWLFKPPTQLCLSILMNASYIYETFRWCFSYLLVLFYNYLLWFITSCSVFMSAFPSFLISLKKVNSLLKTFLVTFSLSLSLGLNPPIFGFVGGSPGIGFPCVLYLHSTLTPSWEEVSGYLVPRSVAQNLVA